MAVEELSNSPYPQMILEAIDAVGKPDGADKTSISDYIASKYQELPKEHHAELLTTHLAKMKESGELLLISDDVYQMPSSGPNDAPLKRGRGRPPKPKEAGAVAPAAPTVLRGRGRPKKDPNAPPVAKKAKPSGAPSTGRPRGRPRKVQPQQNGVEA